MGHYLGCIEGKGTVDYNLNIFNDQFKEYYINPYFDMMLDYSMQPMSH